MGSLHSFRYTQLVHQFQAIRELIRAQVRTEAELAVARAELEVIALELRLAAGGAPGPGAGSDRPWPRNPRLRDVAKTACIVRYTLPHGPEGPIRREVVTPGVTECYARQCGQAALLAVLREIGIAFLRGDAIDPASAEASASPPDLWDLHAERGENGGSICIRPHFGRTQEERRRARGFTRYARLKGVEALSCAPILADIPLRGTRYTIALREVQLEAAHPREPGLHRRPLDAQGGRRGIVFSRARLPFILARIGVDPPSESDADELTRWCIREGKKGLKNEWVERFAQAALKAIVATIERQGSCLGQHDGRGGSLRRPGDSSESFAGEDGTPGAA
jgi:hypothetical protein